VYPLAVGTIVESKEIWDELSQAIQDLSLRTVFSLTELPSDWPGFLDRIDRLRPDVILLEVTKLREPLDQTVARIRSGGAQPAVFALHREAHPEAILTALRAGAVEFLYPPMAGQLKAALERLGQNREQQGQDPRRHGGKAVAFVSVKGGCGATTLACHVAVELPRHTRTKVLLADLDLQAGMVGFLVKVKTPYTVSDAANNLQRLDPSYWRALISNGIPDLEIISAPTTPAARQLSPQQLKQVVAFARTQYPWTVVDLGRNLSAGTLAVLELIDEAYLVTTHDVPALHQAKQMVQTLVEGGYDRSKLRLLLNRTPRHADVTLKELEGMLGVPIDTTIPNHYQELQDAYSEGRLLDPGSTLNRSFARLAMKIAGVTEKKKKFALFG
jgi:pilus assembly protein CpaE